MKLGRSENFKDTSVQMQQMQEELPLAYCPFFLQTAEPLYVQRNIPQCRCAWGGQHINSVETVQC